MTSPPSGPRLVETLIGGWRPLARVDVAGFALLRSRGITRRANSAVALEAPADLPGAVDRIEQLVALAGERPLFRVLPGHGPEGLDALLAGRGYGLGPVCDLQSRSLEDAPAPHPQARIDIGPLPEDWFAHLWRLGPREGEQARETLHDILAGTPAVHVALGEHAVGRAALVDLGRRRTAVLNCIATDPAHRRQGLGRAVTQTLLAAAAAAGAQQALLEVETDNPAALRLYRRCGFTRFAGYHYRVGPDARPGAAAT